MLHCQKSLLFVLSFLCFSLLGWSQKKPLDHTVYDGWQSVGERKINNNGTWIAYTVDPQEGDGQLVLQKTDATFSTTIPRGYSISFSEDSRFLVCKIKPFFADTRNAKIKKKRPDEFPKDSLAIFDLGQRSLEKIAGVTSYKMPEKAGGLLAYQLVKKSSDSVKMTMAKDTAAKKQDSVKKQIPLIIEQVPEKKQKRKLTATGENDDVMEDAEGDEGAAAPVQEGTELVVLRLGQKKSKTIPLTSDYLWSENGKILLVESSSSKSNKNIKPMVYIWRAVEDRFDTLLVGGNDFRNFAIDEDGYQVAFVAERDSAFKSLQKFHKLWYWQNGDAAATVLADKFTPGMKINWTISENYAPNFSKSGKRLFLGTTPIKPIKDTSLIDMDLVKVDVWHYNDDYLQPYQLRTAEMENRKSYLAMVDLSTKKLTQLADLDLPQVMIAAEGDGKQFLGMSDKGKRVASQWEGGTKKDIYLVDPTTGSKKIIAKDLSGMPQFSPEGNHVVWYDAKQRHYFSYHEGQNINISKQVPVKLYDEENDMPADPSPYGPMRWQKNDEALYVYDRYDIWKLDPKGLAAPINITAGNGRKTHQSYRYVSMDPEERAVQAGQTIHLRIFDEKTKHAGVGTMELMPNATITVLQKGAFAMGFPTKAKNASAYLYTKESFASSPNIHFSNDLVKETTFSSINPQQAQYNWMKAELFSWKAYDGKMTTGIVYKPENFDPSKKYPMIAYFYETLSDGLFSYLSPSPTPSRLNIPFFVSRGYIVLAPDIHYTDGYPGKAAFDYVVSGARALVKKGWVDSTKMGIQGQSWGGYQVAHIITRTNLFAAAWAGAPVVNMTSAYGGIRWESGMNRQFQYEKTQSRIGATLWEKPQLYIENSPLFHLPKVKTPVVIMSNDNDGAVPWYQGIEMFTAMRRLNKKVWMLNYNGEAHNLVERKNRKDIQIREQQFFDWLLKGEKPAVWLTDGVPATEKGRSWGLETKLDQ